MNDQLVVSALEQTDKKLYEAVDGGASWLAAIRKRGARVEKYRRYERGDQDSNLTVQQRRLLNIQEDDAGLNESCSNYCGIVVDMMSGRLVASEITSPSDEANKWINDTLDRNGFESRQGEWFRGAIRDSESYVLIDPQTALWSSEPAFDGYSGVIAIFDTMTNLPIWACKLWSVSEPADVSTDFEDLGDARLVHLIVYQPDKITYWEGEDGGGEVTKVLVPEQSSLKVIDEGNGYVWELGVIPMVQFANKRDNYTPYGESEIRPVVPLQDILNATLYDMQMASKLSAFKVYWSIGMEIDKDGIVPGSVINLVLKDNSGNIVTNIDESLARFLSTVKVGEFGTTDMSQYTNQLDKLEREISQISQTPVYGITTQGALSGEALKQLESGLINKVIRFQKENSQAIVMLLKMTAEIQREYDVNSSFLQKFTGKLANFLGLSAPSAPPADLGDISINWKSPEVVSTEAQIAALSQLRRDNPGLWADEWYRERIGTVMGMSSAQVADEGEKAELEQVNSLERLVGNRGQEVPF